MRRIGLVLILAAVAASAVAPAAWAAGTPALCKALRGLADEARSTREPLRFSVGADAAQACRPSPENAATRSFCASATTANGLAWRLYDCVNTLAADPQVVTTGEYAERRSRQKITRLTAALAHGVRLDLSLATDRYDVVVWSPK